MWSQNRRAAGGLQGLTPAVLHAVPVSGQRLLGWGVNEVLAERAPVPQSWKETQLVMMPKVLRLEDFDLARWPRLRWRWSVERGLDIELLALL